VKVIGLTGGIGSGKSSVANWLSRQGIPVFDADRTVHELLAYDQETIKEVCSVFGSEILSEAGNIDRRALGNRVFLNSSERIQLEEILHPRVALSMQKKQQEIEERGNKVCVWDVPLLFEAGFDSWVNEIWVVWVPLAIQKERVMKRDALSLEAVELRIQAQFSLDEKVKKADVVIDNSREWKITEQQLVKELTRIKTDLGI
jgi:dephospho-CoA kinase